jgi:hypothetical protein
MILYILRFDIFLHLQPVVFADLNEAVHYNLFTSPTSAWMVGVTLSVL